MIPAKFDYVRPGSVDEAVSALADGGEDAKVIAGGQSLLPLLRLRLAYPSCWSTSAASPSCAASATPATRLVIGAMTTHHEVIHDPLVAEHAPCWPRPPARSPTRRSGTGARSAARSRTPTRPVTCPRWRSRWTRRVVRGPGGEREIPAARLLRRLPDHSAAARARC